MKAEKRIALAGNPNVGKSTVFNSLTGLRQHTGNWPGKTVSTAEGLCRSEKYSYRITDIPGTYSLAARSAEEEAARDFICFENVDAVLTVCDATCLERNMNLLLQIMETGKPVLLCINLMDEAKRKGIEIDIEGLSERLGLPVIGIVAHEKASRDKVLSALDKLMEEPAERSFCMLYPEAVENAIQKLSKQVDITSGKLDSRWLCLKLLEGDREVQLRIERLGGGFNKLLSAAERERAELSKKGIDGERFEELIVSRLIARSEELCRETLNFKKQEYDSLDRRIDSILTGKFWAYPLMLLLLMLVFYISIVGANYPSQLLSRLLFGFQEQLLGVLEAFNAPPWLKGILLDGAYRVLAWVVSVMLPSMAIFFPLFTILEDAGYLPRVAYNLDAPFKRCKACGKQALTMCMGFGCNAAGVTGCRIIDSERERLIAMLTNSFVPCNGRFPTLIAVIGMFFAAESGLISALLLSAMVVLGIAASFLASRLLSETLLKGMASSFVLELPPYRKPQIGKVIVRSVMDRTLFVLGRAAAVAAPAGAVIWLLANVRPGGESLISICADLLEPLGRFMGMDGAILLAFILGLPANEIVFPLIIMIYTAQGSITELGDMWQIKEILLQNGWTGVTALCVMLFSVMHWPCSTTLLTVKKESGSWKWTAVAALLPAAAGFMICSIISFMAK